MRRLLPAIALAAGTLAGCGADQNFVRDRDATLQLRLDEYRIAPEAIRVRPGRVRVVARNVGRLTHNVVVQSFERQEGGQPYVFGRTDTTHPGEVVGATLHLRPGKYRLVCTIANHDDLGQYGELRVG